MKPHLDINSLPVQMILSFIAVVLLTTAAVGLPAIWLIRDQLNRQGWAQVEQGQRAALAIYHARQSEIVNLAVLSAQRPTLNQYLQDENWDGLGNYLETLRAGAGLDLLVVCSPAQNIIASTQTGIPIGVCQNWQRENYQVLEENLHPQVWLTATHPLETSSTPAQIVVGMKLDNDFTTQLLVETGLDHTIWVNGVPAATSFNGGVENIDLSPQQHPSSRPDSGLARSLYEFNGQPYFSVHSPLSLEGIDTEAALNVAKITATQQSLIAIMTGAILVVAFVVSTLGIYLSQRISKPLVQLAYTAEGFRKGDLSTPVAVDARVREVAQVSRALEAVRIDLQRTMNSLEREKAWVDHLLESIVEGIMTLDSQGSITYFSQGAERISGWRRDEVIGRSCDEVFLLPETDAPFSESIRNTGSRIKLLIELADGHRATLAVTKAHLAPLEAGDAQSVLVFRDVSEGEIIHRILGNFLSNIAHEFRTPLSSAAASIELLIDQAPELSDAELQELLNALHLGILGLGTLVDNLLECASIEAGRFHVSPRACDIAEIINRASQTMQPLFQKYGQRLKTALPDKIPAVRADERRVEQVLVNLLSNASKFGPTDAEILVSVRIKKEWVQIQVTDRGPGIADEQRAYLFRMVTYPGKMDDRANAGAGLGLMVVEAIVEAHGGTVGLQGHPDGGSIFWFTLPLVEAFTQEGK